MKTSISTKNAFIGILGLAAAAVLPSCVDPYYQPSHVTTTTTYRAGYEVQQLPRGYRTEVISGTRYYVHDDVYYRPRAGRYVVVEAPRGPRYAQPRRDVVINRLPSGYRVVTHRGNRYYQVNDVYYRQRGSDYVLVERPY